MLNSKMSIKCIGTDLEEDMMEMDADILEADLSSDDDIDYRVVTLRQMKETTFFKKICMFPVNLQELDFFVEQMDILSLFDKIDTKDICNYTPKRLDAAFLILKMINLDSINFCEHLIREFFEKDFTNLFSEYMAFNTLYGEFQTIFAFYDEYCADMGLFFIRYLTTFQKILHSDLNYKMDMHHELENLTDKLTNYCCKLIKCDYYSDITDGFDVEVDKDFFTENYHVFEMMTKQIITYTMNTGSTVLNNLSTLVSKLADNNISDDDLMVQISSIINIDNLMDRESDAIQTFILLMMDNLGPEIIRTRSSTKFTTFDNFLYPFEKKCDNKKYSFWINQLNNKTWETPAQFSHTTFFENKIEKNGMKIYKDYYGILMTFVYHNFAQEESQLVKMIINLMEDSRNDPGIINKYDDIDLETSFMMYAISNDINETYDSFLIKLEDKFELPTYYPIEYILRILSRMLSVIIYFYDDDLTCTIIDNTINQIYQQPIQICQQNLFKYYLLYSQNDDEFSPLNEINWVTSRVLTEKKSANIKINNKRIIEV
jgi:hypothetical protein